MPINSRILVPQETANNNRVTVVALISENRSLVEADEVVCEIETSKSTVEITSPASGYIEFLVEEGQELDVGACLALIHDGQIDLTARNAGAGPDASPETPSQEKTAVGSASFSKGALDLVSKYGLERGEFEHLGFVRSTDILEYLGQSGSDAKPRDLKSPSDHIPVFNVSTTIEKVSASKALEIDYLTSGQNSISSSVSIKVRVRGTETKKTEGARPGSVGAFKGLDSAITPLILSATCSLLKEHTVFNSFYHSGQIYHYEEVQVGYAMDMGRGLKVVNLGDLSDQPVSIINGKILDFVRQYLTNKIRPQDLVDSTFTVSDLSSEACLSFMPLINRYQGAVLGIAAIDEHDNSLTLTLAFDHRVTEGRKACQFLSALKQRVERLLGEQP